jgi:alpha-galactosidase
MTFMQRRHFIKLAGFSTASLFFTRTGNGTGIPYDILDFPSGVAVLCAGKWRTLSGAGEKWSSGPITVSFQHIGQSEKVKVHAPGVELEKIKLTWERAFAPEIKFLGDDWERSYGDLQWQHASFDRHASIAHNGSPGHTAAPLHKAPWYLLIYDGHRTRAFGVKTGAASICYWQIAARQLELYLDTHSGGMGVQLGDRALDAAEIITTQSLPGETPFQTDHRFCTMMCDKPVLPPKPVYGINDWYFAYGNNSKELILQNTDIMSRLAEDTANRPYSVIDDGWSLKLPKKDSDNCWGDDYSRSNGKFGDMTTVADAIKKLGMRPGLWTRTLLANQQDDARVMTPVRKGRQNPKERYLDPTIPENLHRIAHIIGLYKDWGFELVKHDYSTYDFFGRWGFEMKEELTSPEWHFNDRSKTNAEILLELYRTIRRAAGKMLLIGCNTMSHLSAGIFDLNRTGDDTSGKDWARTLKMGVNTLGFRLPQHRAFYAADGDCVGLTTQVPWEKNRQWLQLLAESSAPLFISAQPEALRQEQKALIRRCFTLAAKPQPLGEPLDWLTDPRPAKWKLNGRIVNFDWI